MMEEISGYRYPSRDGEGFTCDECGLAQPPTTTGYCRRCRMPYTKPENEPAANGYGTGRRAVWQQYPKGYRGHAVSFVIYDDGRGDSLKVPKMDPIVSNESRTVEEVPCYDNGVFFIIDEVKDEEWNVYAWEEGGAISKVPRPNNDPFFRRKYEAIKFADECLANELEDGAM